MVIMRILVMLVFAGTSGGVHVADRYTVSADSVSLIREMAPRAVNVGDFSALDGIPVNEIPCAGVSIAPSENGTFSEYIRAALIAELKMAGSYSDKSTKTISASLEALAVDASAFSAAGEWYVRLNLNSGNRSFEVSESYRFKSQAVSSTACEIASRRFAPAIQNLVAKIIAAPEFAELIKE